MKQLLAFKSTTYGGSKADGLINTATTPALLADGAVGIYAINPATNKLILVTAASNLADVKEFFIARGTSDGAILSDGMERKTLEITKQAAVTPTGRTITISNIPANLPAGTLVEVVVVDTSKTTQTDWRAKRYSYRTIAANETATVIAAALAPKVDKNTVVSASAAAGVITIIGETSKVTFDAYLEYGDTATTIRGVVTAAALRPIGSVTGMRALQRDAEAYQGKTNYIDITTGDTKSGDQVTDGVTYVVYNISTIGTTVRLAVATDPVAMRFKRLVLAVPTGSASIAALDTLLAATAMEELAGQAEEIGV